MKGHLGFEVRLRSKNPPGPTTSPQLPMQTFQGTSGARHLSPKDRVGSKHHALLLKPSRRKLASAASDFLHSAARANLGDYSLL